MVEVRFTEQFLRAVKKENKEALKDALKEIAGDPYHARGSHPLSHDWAGFRGADFVGAKRFVYRICGECIQKKQQALHPLGCCAGAQTSEQVITFVDFGDYHAGAGRRRLRPAPSYEIQATSDDQLPGDQPSASEHQDENL